MGAGIAMNFASVGIPVKILDQQPESLTRITTYRIDLPNFSDKGEVEPAAWIVL